MLSSTEKIILVVTVPCVFFLLLFTLAIMYRALRRRRLASLQTPNPAAISTSYSLTKQPQCPVCPTQPSASSAPTATAHQTPADAPSASTQSGRLSVGLPSYGDVVLSVKRISTHPQTDKVRRVSSVASIILGEPTNAPKIPTPIGIVDGERRLSIVSTTSTSHIEAARPTALERDQGARMEILNTPRTPAFDLGAPPTRKASKVPRDSIAVAKPAAPISPVSAPEPPGKGSADLFSGWGGLHPHQSQAADASPAEPPVAEASAAPEVESSALSGPQPRGSPKITYLSTLVDESALR